MKDERREKAKERRRARDKKENEGGGRVIFVKSGLRLSNPVWRGKRRMGGSLP